MRDDRSQIRSSSATSTARSSPVTEDGARRPGGRWCAKPRTPARSRPSSSNDVEHQRRTDSQGDTAVSIDDVTSRRRPQEELVPLRPAHPGVPRCSSRRSPRRCRPSARWRGPTSTTGTGWPRAASEVFELARCPRGLQRSRHQRRAHAATRASPSRRPQRATVVRGGILEMDEPEHSTYRGALNPYLSPAAIKRWQPFVDEIVRAATRREDRVGPHRLRRRPGQHRARGADAGDDGHRAEEVDDLQRAGARCRCPPRSTRPTPSGSPR